MPHKNVSPVNEAAQNARRSFLTRMNAGLASFAAMAGVAMAKPKSSDAAARWEPARHEKDDWFDRLPGKHRVVFDTTLPLGLGDAVAFAANFYAVNRSEYGIPNNELAVVIVVRHRSTPFGYNDAMWAKYGMNLAARSGAQDPKTKSAPAANLYNASDYGDLLPTRGMTLEGLAKAGVQFAVCSVATRAYAGGIAREVGSTPDAIFAELTSNLIGNARMVPAGIVAVNRAQERGYSLVTA